MCVLIIWSFGVVVQKYTHSDDRSLEELKNAVDAGDAHAAYVLGVKYFHGQGVPAVNQCELCVGTHDDATISFCQSKNITYQSFAPLRSVSGQVLLYMLVHVFLCCLRHSLLYRNREATNRLVGTLIHFFMSNFACEPCMRIFARETRKSWLCFTLACMFRWLMMDVLANVQVNLTDARLSKIATAHGVSTAQV